MNKLVIQIDPYKNKVSEIIMSVSEESIALYFKGRNFDMSKFYSGSDLIIFEEFLYDGIDTGKPFIFGNLNKLLSGKALIIGVEGNNFTSPSISKEIVRQNYEVIEDKSFINFYKKEANLMRSSFLNRD